MALLEKSDVERFTKPVPEDRSIRYLKKKFEKALGDEWEDFEIETLAAEFKPEEVTPLLIAKFRVLKVMEDDRSRFYEDPIFALHVIDIINGDLPDSDPSTLPHVTSLELAYGLDLIRDMYPSDDLDAIRVLARLILRDEGYRFIPKGFEDLLTEDDIPSLPDTVKSDNAAKQQAIDTYLKLMELTDRA